MNHIPGTINEIEALQRQCDRKSPSCVRSIRDDREFMIVTSMIANSMKESRGAPCGRIVVFLVADEAPHESSVLSSGNVDVSTCSASITADSCETFIQCSSAQERSLSSVLSSDRHNEIVTARETFHQFSGADLFEDELISSSEKDFSVLSQSPDKYPILSEKERVESTELENVGKKRCRSPDYEKVIRSPDFYLSPDMNTSISVSTQETPTTDPICRDFGVDEVAQLRLLSPNGVSMERAFIDDELPLNMNEREEAHLKDERKLDQDTPCEEVEMFGLCKSETSYPIIAPECRNETVGRQSSSVPENVNSASPVTPNNHQLHPFSSPLKSGTISITKTDTPFSKLTGRDFGEEDIQLAQLAFHCESDFLSVDEMEEAMLKGDIEPEVHEDFSQQDLIDSEELEREFAFI